MLETKKNAAFATYDAPMSTSMKGRVKIFFFINKISRMCLKRKMPTYYLNINPMIEPFSYKLSATSIWTNL